MFVYEVTIHGRPGRWFLVGTRSSLITGQIADVAVYPQTYPTRFHAVEAQRETLAVLRGAEVM